MIAFFVLLSTSLLFFFPPFIANGGGTHLSFRGASAIPSVVRGVTLVESVENVLRTAPQTLSAVGADIGPTRDREWAELRSLCWLCSAANWRVAERVPDYSQIIFGEKLLPRIPESNIRLRKETESLFLARQLGKCAVAWVQGIN